MVAVAAAVYQRHLRGGGGAAHIGVFEQAGDDEVGVAGEYAELVRLSQLAQKLVSCQFK